MSEAISENLILHVTMGKLLVCDDREREKVNLDITTNTTWRL